MKEEHSRIRPVEAQEDAPQFFETVAHDANLSTSDAAQATEALFHAIKQELPPRKITAVGAVLPKRLKQTWQRA